MRFISPRWMQFSLRTVLAIVLLASLLANRWRQQRNIGVATRLETVVQLSRTPMSLGPALDELAAQSGVRIEIDEATLGQSGQRLQGWVRYLEPNELSAGQLLTWWLHDAGLGYDIDSDLFGEYVLISDYDTIYARRYPARTYPLDHIVRSEWDARELSDLVVSMVDPVNWDDVGGPATLQVRNAGQSLTFYIRQTPERHREIAEFLKRHQNRYRSVDTLPKHPEMEDVLRPPWLDDFDQPELSIRWHGSRAGAGYKRIDPVLIEELRSLLSARESYYNVPSPADVGSDPFELCFREGKRLQEVAISTQLNRVAFRHGWVGDGQAPQPSGYSLSRQAGRKLAKRLGQLRQIWVNEASDRARVVDQAMLISPGPQPCN